MFTMEITRLIERCRRGDAEVLGELYKAYAQRMRGVCRRYISNEDVVSDVLHDAFVIIFTSFDRLRDTKKAESWMMMITRNVVSKYKDHLNALPVISLKEVPEKDLLAVDDEIHDVRGIPLEEVIKIIDKLPEGYGKVFRLSVFEGLSHKEIAALIGIEPHSSSSQLARAKKLLRKMMQQYWIVLLLLLFPLTLFLLKKEETSVKVEKPIVAKQKNKPKDKPKHRKQKKQKNDPSSKQAQEPVIVQLPVHHTNNNITMLQPVIAEVMDSIKPDTQTNMISQEQTIPDTIQGKEQADKKHVTENLILPHYDTANLLPDKPTIPPKIGKSGQ